MKRSVSLSEQDWEFLEGYAKEASLPSRSAAVHAAVVSLRDRRLAGEYAEAWSEWAEGGDAAAWEPSVGDGLQA
jgi:Arc/MetJ-type ribon-helix-helix transcriptional regulator